MFTAIEEVQKQSVVAAGNKRYPGAVAKLINVVNLRRHIKGEVQLLVANGAEIDPSFAYRQHGRKMQTMKAGRDI